MNINWFKNITSRLTEIVISILLVLLFFLILLKVLTIFFPQGNSLQMLSSRRSDNVGHGQRDNRNLKMSRGTLEYDLAESGDWVAVLEKIERNVKSKRAAGIAWRQAKKGMSLYDHDAVQTLKGSTATIRFDQKNHLKMADNSLVIIKRYEEDLLFREKRSFMVMVDGALEGNISSEGEKSVYLEVTTPAAVTRIKAKKTDGEESRFKITVDEDKSSVVTVYSGKAEVESMGEKVIIESNHSSRIKMDVAPSVPVPLPGPSVLRAPADEKIYYYRSLSPKILFDWYVQGLTDASHLMIAHDLSFKDVIVDEVISESSFIHGNLKHGDYYWRVSGLARGGEGNFSPARKITLVQDRIPPELTVSMPPNTTSEKTFVMSGKTEPGTVVFVGESKVELTAGGEFTYKLKLERGINVVVVEAIDAAGNVSYQSELVNFKN